MQAESGSLYAVELHLFIVVERMEKPDGVTSPSYAGEKIIREPAFLFQNLLACFPSDNSLKIPDNHREGMRANY